MYNHTCQRGTLVRVSTSRPTLAVSRRVVVAAFKPGKPSHPQPETVPLWLMIWLNTKFAAMATQLDTKLNTKFSEIDTKFSEIDTKFANIDKQLQTIGKDVKDLSTDLRAMQAQVNLVQGRVEVLQDVVVGRVAHSAAAPVAPVAPVARS